MGAVVELGDQAAAAGRRSGGGPRWPPRPAGPPRRRARARASRAACAPRRSARRRRPGSCRARRRGCARCWPRRPRPRCGRTSARRAPGPRAGAGRASRSRGRRRGSAGPGCGRPGRRPSSWARRSTWSIVASSRSRRIASGSRSSWVKTTIWRVRAARCRTRARPSTFAGSIAWTGSSMTAKRNGDSSSAARGRKTLTESASSSPWTSRRARWRPRRRRGRRSPRGPPRPTFLSVISCRSTLEPCRSSRQFAIACSEIGAKRSARSSSAAPLTHFSASLSAFSVACARLDLLRLRRARRDVGRRAPARPRRGAELGAGALGEGAQAGGGGDDVVAGAVRGRAGRRSRGRRRRPRRGARAASSPRRRRRAASRRSGASTAAARGRCAQRSAARAASSARGAWSSERGGLLGAPAVAHASSSTSGVPQTGQSSVRLGVADGERAAQERGDVGGAARRRSPRRPRGRARRPAAP